MSRSHIYDTVELLDLAGNGDLIETGTFVKVIKPEYQSKWQELLTPEEKAKYDSLSFVEQLSIAMSCNSFRALGAEE